MTLADRIMHLPDYLADLNAIREAVLGQPAEIQWGWFAHLASIVSADKPAALGDAAQWSKALLLALNLWTDEPPQP